MSAAPTFKLLALISIAESKSNPRSHFDKDKLDELAESIKLNGVLEPILVRTKGDEGYELVCGHRRYRAAKLAEVRMIPAMIHELNDTQVLETQLEENTKRGDLHPLEEAAGYQALLAKKHGYTVARIAERTGKSVKYIYDRIKLLDLTKEAQGLFLADRITAGHAILLARLSPKDQERAIDPESAPSYGSHGVWQGEHALFDGDDEEHEKDPYRGLKAVSVRELETWIDRSVRFDRKLIEPVLFPDTAEKTIEADAGGRKIIPITHDHGLSPDLKGDERTICCNSWKRADGQAGSKTCEHKILGVLVVGRDRGKAFDVCTAKEKCKTHWSKEMAARKRAATQREKGGGKTPDKPKRKDKWEIQREKSEAARKVYVPAIPAIIQAVADRVLALPTDAHGVLADVIVNGVGRGTGLRSQPLVPRGDSAEDLIRHVAFIILAEEADDDWNGHNTFPPIAKALGIDLKKLLKEHAPEEKKGTTAGVCRECGCTDDDCTQCVEKTGQPCTWVKPDLCSACAPAPAKAKKRKAS